MKLKQLASALQEVPAFGKPDYELEQYKTGAELAAQIIFAIESSFGDLSGKIVLDLGCGTGILGIGAALMGADSVIMCDCDPGALRQAAEINAEEFELPLEFVHAVVGDDGRLPLRVGSCIDTVLMNPPFGTRRAGADIAFLRAAVGIVSSNNGVVYSLHKSSTRAHLVRTADALGVGCSLVAQLKFDIPATYAFHTSDSLDVDVDLLRFVKGPGAAAIAAAHASMSPYVPAASGAASAGSRSGGPRSRGRGASGPSRGGRGGGRR